MGPGADRGRRRRHSDLPPPDAPGAGLPLRQSGQGRLGVQDADWAGLHSGWWTQSGGLEIVLAHEDHVENKRKRRRIIRSYQRTEGKD